MKRPEAVEAFIAEVGYDRVQSVTACIEYKGTWYIIWKEAGVGLRGLPTVNDFAVHVFDFKGHDGFRILRSGDYRMTQLGALRRVIELMEGVTV